jgi:hypothetical protein
MYEVVKSYFIGVLSIPMLAGLEANGASKRSDAVIGEWEEILRTSRNIPAGVNEQQQARIQGIIMDSQRLEVSIKQLQTLNLDKMRKLVGRLTDTALLELGKLEVELNPYVSLSSTSRETESTTDMQYHMGTGFRKNTSAILSPREKNYKSISSYDTRSGHSSYHGDRASRIRWRAWFHHDW